MKKVIFITGFVLMVFLILININTDKEEVLLVKSEEYKGNSVIFRTITNTPEVVGEKDIKNYLSEVNNKIELALINDKNTDFDKSLAEINQILIQNGFEQVEAIGEDDRKYEKIFLYNPMIYFNKKANSYLIMTAFHWNKDSLRNPYWINDSNNITINDQNMSAEIFDSFKIDIKSESDNSLEIVNETMYLITFSENKGYYIFNTPKEINPSTLEYQGDDYYFYANSKAQNTLDYSWDHGIMFFYFISDANVQYEVQPTYLHNYYH